MKPLIEIFYPENKTTDTMKAKEIIKHFEGTETDSTEVVTSAEFLESLGWDFSEETRTNKDEVVILIQANENEQYQIHYHLRPSNSTYTIEAYNSTGDDKQALIDISENIQAFSRI